MEVVLVSSMTIVQGSVYTYIMTYMTGPHSQAPPSILLFGSGESLRMRLTCQYSRVKVTNSSPPSLPELTASDPEGHQGSGGDVGGAGEGLH